MEYKFNFKTEEDKELLIKNNENLNLKEIAYLLEGNYLIFTDEEINIDTTLEFKTEEKISALEYENEKLKVKIDEQNKFIINNMLAIADMYEINRNYYLSLNEASLKEECKRVPTHIQSVYQKLYKLGLKALNEIPFEIRINLKA